MWQTFDRGSDIPFGVSFSGYFAIIIAFFATNIKTFAKFPSFFHTLFCHFEKLRDFEIFFKKGLDKRDFAWYYSRAVLRNVRMRV
jgi:hypothetical protein